MALTDNRTQLNDCQDDAQTFATSGAQLNTNTLAGNTLITPNSVQVQHSNTYDDTYTTGDSAGATFNLGAAGADTTIYIAIKDNGYDLANVVGAGVVVGDGTDRIGYSAGGSDALGLPYQKVFNIFKLDTSDAAANPGTADVDHHVFAGTEANLNFSAITAVGYGGIHNAKAQGNVPNVFISGIYYIANDSYAATVTGGSAATPETMADLVGDDETVGAGMFSNPIGSAYYLFAPTEFGDVTAATNSGFSGTDEQWFYLGNNGGGRGLGATHFPMRLVGGTGTNVFYQTRVVNVNTGTRAQFDMSSTSVNEVKLDSTSWIDFGVITFPAQSAGNKFCDSSVFVNCDQMIVSTLDMDGCTWSGTTDANGAIIWDENNTGTSNQTNSTFVSDGTGNAINIAPTGTGPFSYSISGYTFDGYAGQDGTAGNRVFYIDPVNNDASTITINLTNCTAVNQVGTGSGFSYELAPGVTGTPTITATVTLTLTGIETDSEVIITNLDDTTNFDPTLASTEQVTGSLTAATIQSGGSGYTNGTQTLTLTGGTFTTAAQVSVEVVGGAVDSINSITVPGSYTLNPTNPVSTTGGGGTGATLNCTFGGTFQYSYDAGNLFNVAITVFHLDFVEVRLIQTLSSTSQTIPIQQRSDRVFNNP
jgi:hypothetical protein